jgi:hypothetical protein
MKNENKKTVLSFKTDQIVSDSITMQNMDRAANAIKTDFIPARPVNCLLHACVCMKEQKR